MLLGEHTAFGRDSLSQLALRGLLRSVGGERDAGDIESSGETDRAGAIVVCSRIAVVPGEYVFEHRTICVGATVLRDRAGVPGEGVND